MCHLAEGRLPRWLIHFQMSEDSSEVGSLLSEGRGLSFNVWLSLAVGNWRPQHWQIHREGTLSVDEDIAVS